MRKITKVIIHCSASDWGDAAEIDRWHRERGWSGIGYHFVVLNGRRRPSSDYVSTHDGIVEEGRPLDVVGAHCRGHNRDSVGICLVGDHHFTARQLLMTLPNLLRHCMETFGLGPEDIYGHRQFNKYKTCPNFDVEWIRRLL